MGKDGQGRFQPMVPPPVSYKSPRIQSFLKSCGSNCHASISLLIYFNKYLLGTHCAHDIVLKITNRNKHTLVSKASLRGKYKHN